MTALALSNIRPRGAAALAAPTKTTERPSRLLTGIYHDIGMAAVAISLDLPLDSLDPATHDSVKRGARYIYLMPKQQNAPTR
jgi:hypothetical protein